jgi:uncharacterized protein (TIGR03382 family)
VLSGSGQSQNRLSEENVMKNVIVSLIAVAGMSVAANAQLMKMLVSTDGVNFSNQVNAVSGQTVQVLVTASYTGTSNAIAGFGSANFQPTVSNWHAADTLLPLRQGGNTLPVGGGGMIQPQFYVGTTAGSGSPVHAAYVPGTYGRVNPMGRTFLGATDQLLTGFVHVDPAGPGSGTFLRIAQASNTNWIGGAGNTSGGSGVNCAQLYSVGRTTDDPDFWGNHELTFDPAGGWDVGVRIAALDVRRQNVELFRFAFTLDGTAGARDMTVDAPLAGQQFDAASQSRYMGFYNNASNTGPGFLTPVTVQTGLIHVNVPTPASLALLGLGGLVVGRRRR